MTSVTLVLGDITKIRANVIVNAANDFLMPGGGVCGAIHEAAGPELAVACEKIGFCQAGDAAITPAFRLTANHVVHAVGPMWHGGKDGEHRLLEAAYTNAMRLAAASGANDIAFPSISTGSHGFPVRDAAAVASDALCKAAEQYPAIQTIYFCCSSVEDLEVYKAAFARTARLCYPTLQIDVGSFWVPAEA